MSTALQSQTKNNPDFFSLMFPDKFVQEVEAVHNDIARLAFDLFQARPSGWGTAMDDWLRAESELLKPVPVSVKEEKDQLTVTADVPGFSFDQLKVHVEGRNLQICGKAETTEKTDGDGRSTSRRICCDVVLPTSVKAEAATAKLDKGVLTMVLPKAQAQTEIEVKAAA